MNYSNFTVPPFSGLLGKAFNIDYGKIDFEKAKFEILTSTQI